MRLYRYLILYLIAVSLYTIVKPAISADNSVDARIVKSYGRLPLSFVENKGQLDKRARYVITGPKASAFFRNDGVTFDMWDASKKAKQDNKPKLRKHAVLKLTFKGADPKCRVEGIDTLPGKVNYMIGNDKSKWHTNVPTCRGVIYKNVWQGIDIIYRGDRSQLKYDIRVNPDADIRKVRLQYDGVEKIWLDKKGDLHIKTAVTEFIEKVPGIYQEKAGKKIDVIGGYRLMDKKTVGFSVRNADPSLPLVIDPASDLIYSTFLGGNDGSESGAGIAVDSNGCVYVMGVTSSTNFPTTSGALLAGNDLFITKLNPSGSQLVYSTFLGGSYTEDGADIAVDSAGCAYVTGYTRSYNFPTTPGALDTVLSDGGNDPSDQDGFVTKLNANGSALLYSTYLGGSGIDEGKSIAVDAIENAYVTGWTRSPDFPTTPDAYDTEFDGGQDGFVIELNQLLTSPVYSTFLGGDNVDTSDDIAIDSSGCVYVSGWTNSSDFQTTVGAYSTTGGGGFVVKLDETGRDLVYSTFTGPSSSHIAIDSLGCVYLGGNGVRKLSDDGSHIIYSTIIKGSSSDQIRAIAVDSSGCAYVTGFTRSSDFPITEGAFSTSLNGTQDAFITKLNASGDILLYSTFLGGNDADLFYHDDSRAIAVDSSGYAYVTGSTSASDFPTTPEAFDTSFNWNPDELGDAFVAKLNMRLLKPDLIIKAGAESSYSGTGIFNTDGTDQTKSLTTSPGQKVTYAFKVINAGRENDSFKIKGPVGEIGWIVKYSDLTTGAEITSLMVGSGWSSGIIVPGASKGICVTVKPDASITAGAVYEMLITATSDGDNTKTDVVKAVTNFVGTYKTDMLIKSGTEASYSGLGTINTDGNNQTKSQNVSVGQKVICAFRAFNAGNANDSFKISGPAGGNGWTVKYLDLSTNADVTSQVIGSGWSTGVIAPRINKGVYAQIKPDATVPLGSTITLTITGRSESDNTKTDVVKSIATCVAGYKPDLTIKNGSEAVYAGIDIFNTDGTNQTKSQSASAGQKVTYSFRIKNSGYMSDSIKITGTAGGAGWSVKYYDLASVDITSQVTGSGWLSGTLAPGTDKGFFVKVSPDASVTSGASKTVLITATSVGDVTKKDVVKAVTTVP
ncbi:MAG: DUF7948 domain-containing protein [Armatimonadota bacterium]